VAIERISLERLSKVHHGCGVGGLGRPAAGPRYIRTGLVVTTCGSKQLAATIHTPAAIDDIAGGPDLIYVLGERMIESELKETVLGVDVADQADAVDALHGGSGVHAIHSWLWTSRRRQ